MAVWRYGVVVVMRWAWSDSFVAGVCVCGGRFSLVVWTSSASEASAFVCSFG